MNLEFTFKPEKAIEAILYIAHRVEEPTFHRISKLLYFADRAHLEQYGRFIAGDSYVAMKHGPVPSEIYDMLKAVRGDGNSRFDDMAQAAFSIDGDNGYTIQPLRKADTDFLSISDVECLDAAIAQYGNKSFSELTQISHDAAWDSAGPDDFIKVEQIVKTFDDWGDLLEHLMDPYPGEAV